jgi:uncharacterized protein
MKKEPNIIAAADIHGSYDSWRRIKALLEDGDILAIAGDLFGTIFTRYSRLGKQDYQPEKIKQEFISLSNQKYYVYGNCDYEDFFYGQDYHLNFEFGKLNIFLFHGDMRYDIPSETNIIIYGHTHEKRLEKKDGIIFLNPGSAAFPRDGNINSCAIINKKKIKIITLNEEAIIDEIYL